MTHPSPSTPPWSLRPARRSDLPTVRRVERLAAERFRDRSHLGPFDTVTPLEALQRAVDADLLWVAEAPAKHDAAPQIIGFAAAEPLGDALHLMEVDVLPEWGQRGIGGALVRRVLDEARRGGYPAVTLTTFQDIPWNAPFYAGLGFQTLDPEQWTPALRHQVEAEEAAGWHLEHRVVMRLELTPELATLSAEEALPRLLDEHGGQLYRLSLKLCGHPQDAEDLLQDIFLIAWKKWHQLDGRAHPTTWLYRIAARACARRRRRRAGEPTHIESLSDLLPQGDATIPDLGTLVSPLDEHLQRESQAAVEKAIASLPMHFRMPLVLKEIVELPMADIAAILDLKVATVKTRVHRGRLLLRRALAEVLPQQQAPPPDHPRQMCLDLLQAKQEALDRGVPFDVPQEDLCLRCRSLFATLDLGHGICESLRQGDLPPRLRQTLAESFESAKK